MTRIPTPRPAEPTPPLTHRDWRDAQAEHDQAAAEAAVQTKHQRDRAALVRAALVAARHYRDSFDRQVAHRTAAADALEVERGQLLDRARQADARAGEYAPTVKTSRADRLACEAATTEAERLRSEAAAMDPQITAARTAAATAAGVAARAGQHVAAFEAGRALVPTDHPVDQDLASGETGVAIRACLRDGLVEPRDSGE